MDASHIDDILPLISVQKTRLEHFKRDLDEQELNGSAENPIYYFSAKLKISPSTVSAYFAKSPKTFLHSQKQHRKIFDTLIAYGVELNSILNVPATFRMNPCKVEERLVDLRTAAIKPIQSWMVSCGSSQFNE